MGIEMIVTCDRCEVKWKPKKAFGSFKFGFSRELYLCKSCESLYRELLAKLDMQKAEVIEAFLAEGKR